MNFLPLSLETEEMSVDSLMSFDESLIEDNRQSSPGRLAEMTLPSVPEQRRPRAATPQSTPGKKQASVQAMSRKKRTKSNVSNKN